MKHKRQVIFIRTQCDNAIRGLEDEYEDEDLTRDELFDRLKENFEAYMQKDVFDASGKELGKMALLNFVNFDRIFAHRI